MNGAPVMRLAKPNFDKANYLLRLAPPQCRQGCELASTFRLNEFRRNLQVEFKFFIFDFPGSSWSSKICTEFMQVRVFLSSLGQVQNSINFFRERDQVLVQGFLLFESKFKSGKKDRVLVRVCNLDVNQLHVPFSSSLTSSSCCSIYGSHSTPTVQRPQSVIPFRAGTDRIRASLMGLRR